MYSMTGYGKAEYAENGITLTVELKTVNNRVLDLNIKAPRVFAAAKRLSLSRGVEPIRSVMVS